MQLDYMTKPIRSGGEIRNILDYDVGESKNYSGGLFRWFCTNRGEQRRRLCEGLRSWLLELKRAKAPLEILIGGLFVTKDPRPNIVDVACIRRMPAYVRGRSVKGIMDELLTNESHILRRYGCFVHDIQVRAAPSSKKDDEKLYVEMLELFGFDGKYNPTLFRVCL